MIRQNSRLLFLTTLVLFFFITPAFAGAANIYSNICSGAASGAALCSATSNSDPLTGSNGLLLKAADVIAIIAGVGAVIMIIISGFRFITSGGDPAKAQAARSTLMGAIIGLIVIALAYTIIGFVLSKIL